MMESNLVMALTCGLAVAFLVAFPVFVLVWLDERKFRALIGRTIDYALWCSPHQAVHGGKLSDYFDADLFLSDPKNIDLVLRWFVPELESRRKAVGRIDRLVFVEKEEGPVGALTLKDICTWKTRIPSAVVRPSRRGPAMRVKTLHDELWLRPTANYKAKKLPFEANFGPERVILVSDVSTTGTTIINAVKRIKKSGGEVDAAFVLYDRQDKSKAKNGSMLTAEERLAEDFGVKLVAMVRANEMRQEIAADSSLCKRASEKGIAIKDAEESSLTSCGAA